MDQKRPKLLPTEVKLELRFAEVNFLISALEVLPPESKNKVTYTELIQKLKRIKDYWLKLEKERQLKSTRGYGIRHQVPKKTN